MPALHRMVQLLVSEVRDWEHQEESERGVGMAFEDLIEERKLMV